MQSAVLVVALLAVVGAASAGKPVQQPLFRFGFLNRYNEREVLLDHRQCLQAEAQKQLSAHVNLTHLGLALCAEGEQSEEPLLIHGLRQAADKVQDEKTKAEFKKLVDQLHDEAYMDDLRFIDKLAVIYSRLADFLDAHPNIRAQVHRAPLGDWGNVYDLKTLVTYIQRPRMSTPLGPGRSSLPKAVRDAFQGTEHAPKAEQLAKVLEAVGEPSYDKERVKLPQVYKHLAQFVRENPKLKARLLSADIEGWGPMRTFYETAAMVSELSIMT